MANPNPSPATRFKKGHSKMGGRKNGSLSLISLLKKELKRKPEGRGVSYATALIKKVLYQATVEGNSASQKMVMEYIEGRPRTPIDMGIERQSISEITEFLRLMANTKHGVVTESEKLIG